MNSGGNTSWKAIRIHGPDARELLGAERLAALYRFQNGELADDHGIVDTLREAEVVAPDHVDWTSFPVLAALEAVTRDELFRLRTLILGASPVSPTVPRM
jgi:hypothetical protein